MLLMSALVLVLIFHVIALELFLYWKLWWFDIIVHALGGFAVGLVPFMLREWGAPIPERLLYLVPVVALAVVVALAWEVFEIFFGLTTFENKDVMVDTLIVSNIKLCS